MKKILIKFTRVKSLIPLLISQIFILNLPAQQQIPIYLDEKFNIEERVENALSVLTLQEKVKLCHAQSQFSSAGVARLGIPELHMTDGPHGIRAEMNWGNWEYAQWTDDSCTAFPSLNCLAASWNPDLALQYGTALGAEARYRNKNILLGPGVNIYRTPLNGRNFEYMGEDPKLASVMVVPYIRGVQTNGIAACIKHFVANNQETLRGSINVEMSDRALNEIYLPAFKEGVVQGGAMAVMGAYNKFRGVYCNENSFLLNKILKTDWAFKGIVVSDWNGVHSTMGAALDGADIEMGTDNRKNFDDYFLAASFLTKLENGDIEIGVVNEKVRRILRVIFLTAMNKNKPFGSMGGELHAALAQKIAEQGIVLLKNDENILPLTKPEIKSIAVIGDNAMRKQIVGGGSSELKARYEVSPLDGLKKRFAGKKTIYYAQGYSIQPSENALLNQEAIALAKKADVVIYVGGLNKELGQDCESRDRLSMKLPYQQDELINNLQKANKNLVVVLLSGNAVEMPWVKNVKAIVQSWYPGLEGGNALANILSGDTNPSGKLPFTFPSKIEDTPAGYFGALAYPGNGVDVVYKEDIYVGYRWYDTKNIRPLFAFGYGLSYTSFDFGKAKAEKVIYKKNEEIIVKFNLKNTGERVGEEVVQLYISQENPTEDRPKKELKAFKKMSLKGGETQEVRLAISSKDFAYYSNITNDWKTDAGKYKISIGSSSDQIKSECVITLE